MNNDVIYISDKIVITKKGNELYIESLKKGMTMDEFNVIIRSHPEIKITNFLAVKNVILEAPKSLEKFGELRERVAVEISKDELKAIIVLSVGEDDFKKENIKGLYNEIMAKLKDKGVIFGLKQADILMNIKNGVQIVAAEGLSPVPGFDSVINMYVLNEIKPKISDEDKVDFYELDLINKVNKGDWLGERIDPSPGKPGTSVLGKVIPAPRGKVLPLLYDRKTVEEFREGIRTVLRSRQIGAVHYDGDRIGVSNHLEIIKNVDFKTGNVNFDGYITVKGSIEDSFSVVASKDIEVLGEYGVGSVKEIISKNGSIYIKGGVVGKNKAVIKSEKNIYTKFVSDAKIISKGSLNIASYCINSDIEAREVILDSSNGQIIGGNIKAQIKIVSSIIGSQSEIRTNLHVVGFERDNLKSDLEEVLKKIEEAKNNMAKLKAQIIYFQDDYTDESANGLQKLNDDYIEACEKIKKLGDKRNVVIDCLRTLGEGEIRVLKKMFPNTFLTIRDNTLEIREATLSVSHYFLDGEWKQK